MKVAALPLVLLMSIASFATTTFTNAGKYCGGPSQRIICTYMPASIGGYLSFEFDPSGYYGGSSVTLPDGSKFTDVTWTVSHIPGSTYYQYDGVFGGGQYHTTQVMQLSCRSGRGGGCAWVDHGGTTSMP